MNANLYYIGFMGDTVHADVTLNGSTIAEALSIALAIINRDDHLSRDCECPETFDDKLIARIEEIRPIRNFLVEQTNEYLNVRPSERGNRG